MARGPFWGQKWSRKKWFCDEIILWWVGRGFPKTQMNSIVYRTHLGRLLCPKPWFFNYFKGISIFSGKLVGPWDIPCVSPIALKGPMALFPLLGVYDAFIFIQYLQYAGPCASRSSPRQVHAKDKEFLWDLPIWRSVWEPIQTDLT